MEQIFARKNFIWGYFVRKIKQKQGDSDFPIVIKTTKTQTNHHVFHLQPYWSLFQ